MRTCRLLGILLVVVVILGCEKKGGSVGKKDKLKTINLKDIGFRDLGGNKTFVPVVEAVVSKGVHPGNPLMSSSGVSIEYEVDVKIFNRTQWPIKYTLAKLAFIPCQGKPLVLDTFLTDEGVAVLNPGEYQDFHPRTNGYTLDLVKDAGDKPLQFTVSLFFHDELVLGPFRTNLPNLSELSFPGTSGVSELKLKFF